LIPAAVSSPSAADLESRIQRVAQQAVRTVRWRAVGWTGLAAGGALLLAAAIDFAWRSSSPGPRWLLFAVVLAALVMGILRWLLPAWRFRLSLVQAAGRIEQVFPDLGDRLSSVVALNHGGDAAAASERSATLVERGARDTLERAATIDFERALRPHPHRRLLIGVVTVAAVFAAWSLWQPQAVGLALHRVTMPWSAAPWPRQHVLQLENLPEQVHAGSPLSFAVRDLQGRLPADLQVWWRAASGDPAAAVSLDPAVSAAASRTDPAVRALTLPATRVRQRFALRATGGDDQRMPWQTIEVVRPPEIAAARFQVTPPAYTGLDSFTTEESAFTLPAGSQIAFQATVDRPLRQIDWRIEASWRAGEGPAAPSGEGPEAAEASPFPALQLSEAGTGIQAVGEIPAGLMQVALNIRWVDRAGVPGQSPRSWRLTIEADQPPEVSWQDRWAFSQVGAAAVLPLSWRARDDFGVQASWVELTALLPAAAGETGQGGATVRRLDRTEAAEAAGDLPPTIARQGRLDLAELARAELGPLPENASLRIVGVAIDQRGQRGTTLPLVLQLADESELQRRWAKAAEKVLEQVQEAQRQQQVALERGEESRSRLDADAESQQEAADILRIAAAAQRATERQLEGGPQAAIEAAENVLRQAEISQLEDQVVSAIEAAAERLRANQQAAVLPAGQALEQAAAQLEGTTGEPQAARRRLDEATEKQRESVASLQAVAQDLAARLRLQSVADEVRQLADAQRRLSGQTVRADQARDPEQERARLSGEQQRLARETEALQSRLQQWSAAPTESEQRREAFQQAAEQLRQQQAPQRMRQAAESLRRQRPEQSLAEQRQVTEDLSALARSLQRSSQTGEQEEMPSRQQAQWLREATRIADRQGAIAEAVAQVVAQGGVGSEQAVRDQQAHAARTDRFVEAIDALPLFGEVAREAQQQMLAAAARLERQADDAEATAEARAAARGMQGIAEALQTAARQQPSTEPTAADQSEATADAPPPEADTPPIPLATIFLIRGMQARLQTATKQLEAKQQATDDIAPEVGGPLAAEQQRLARQQRRLREQLSELIETMQEPGR